MRTYKCFYRGQSCVVQADSSYAAQQIAAKKFKAKKSYDVAVVLADVPVDTASI